MKLAEMPNMIMRSGKLRVFFSFFVVLFFLLFVFVPAVYLIALTPQIKFQSDMLQPLLTSFEIAFIVIIVDMVFGVPVAWLLNRHSFPGKEIFRALLDMPLIVPTAALGFSVALFWGSAGLGLLDKGFWLITALHIVFTFPYVVMTVSAAIEQIDVTYEIAGRTLGSSPLTAFRVVATPLFMDGILIGGLLALTRSLSETGATMMVAGVAEKTATVAALGYKNAGDISAAVSISVFLIIVSVLLLGLVKFYAGKKKFSIGKVYPLFERYLSGGEFSKVIFRITAAFFAVFFAWIVARFFYLTNMIGIGVLFMAAAIATLLFVLTVSKKCKIHWSMLLCSALFLLFILFPSFFFVSSLRLEGQYGAIINSLVISFSIALAVTVLNLLFGIPMAFIISQHRLGWVLDAMVDVVLVVPTVALGLSLGMFWGKADVILVLAAAHLSFSYPYVVKPVAAAIGGLSKDLDEAASSLGATPAKVLTTVTFPLILPSILAGAIMAFMRSLSETGATLAVSENIKTVPVLIVDLVKANMNAEAALASFILLIISLLAVTLVRRK